MLIQTFKQKQLIVWWVKKCIWKLCKTVILIDKVIIERLNNSSIDRIYLKLLTNNFPML